MTFIQASLDHFQRHRICAHLDTGGHLVGPTDHLVAQREQLDRAGAPAGKEPQVVHEGGQDMSLAEFLLGHPEHRHSVRRVQIAAQLPYSEIQDNLISADMVPVDLLRCKLSFFGASKFDPRSDRWVRINMYQYAPFPDEINHHYQDDWVYPPL